MRTKDKPSPLTPAERQKLFRQKNTRVDVSKDMLPQLEDLRQHFAKELNEPKLSMKVVLGRLIHEGHYHYCSDQNRITANATAPGAAADEISIVIRNENLCAQGQQDPSKTTEVATTGNSNAQTVTANEPKDHSPAQVSILNSSRETPVKFKDGILWRHGEKLLLVHLTEGIHRKEYLKAALRFGYNQVLPQCWSKVCESEEQLVAVSDTVLGFMNSSPEEQRRRINE